MGIATANWLVFTGRTIWLDFCRFIACWHKPANRMQSICLVYLLHSHQHYENKTKSLKILRFTKSLVLLPTFLFLQVCILWHKLCANKPPKQVTALVHGADEHWYFFYFYDIIIEESKLRATYLTLNKLSGAHRAWNAVVLVHYQINAVPFALYRYCNRHKPTSFFNEILTKRLLGKKKKKMTLATRQIPLDWFWQIMLPELSQLFHYRQIASY